MIEKRPWDDKEFMMWAFGKPQVEITLKTYDEMFNKLYEVYKQLEDGTIRQRYIMEKMNNSIFPKINPTSDKDNPAV